MQEYKQLDMWYYNGMIKWKLREYLDAHNVSAYALAKEADASPTTIYALARGGHERISLMVLDKTMSALEKLTGQRVSVCDLLERE